MKRTVDDGLFFKFNTSNILIIIQNEKIAYTNQGELFGTTILILVQTDTLDSITTRAKGIKRGKNAVGLGNVHFALRNNIYKTKQNIVFLPSRERVSSI